MAKKEFSEENFIDTVTEIIEKNLQNDDFSIEQLYQQLGLSRTHLHRKIKGATELSTSLFIRKIRLEKARVFIETTDRNISEIAYLTGHKSPQNFSKYFIEEFGISPSAYRKKNKGKHQKDTSVKQSVAQKANPSKWLVIGIGLAICLVVLLGFRNKQYLFSVKNQDNTSASELPSIAVIPFQNQSAISDDLLSEGIVEEVLSKLSTFENIKVISKASADQFIDARKSIPQIGRSLEVQYILTGAIKADENRISIKVELLQTSNQQMIWSERYNQPKEKLLTIPAEIAEDIGQSLNQTLDAKFKQELEEHTPTNNTEAYAALLRGRHLMRNRTQEDLLKSLDQFLLALDLDPQFSEAYEGLACVYQLMINLRYAPEQVAVHQQLVEKNVLNAIKYDRSNGNAYAILGNLYADQYRWEEAISSFEIALDLSPQDAMINYWFSLRLRSTGDLERALVYHKKASELDPLHPVIQAGYIYTCALAGEFDLAEALLQEVEPIMNDNFLYHFVKGNLLLRKGNFEEAISYSAKALELNPDFKASQSDQFYCIGKLGRKQEVQQYMAELNTQEGIDCLRAAKAAMSIEAPDMALNFLQQAADLGVIDDDLLAEPIFSSLRNHPLFLEIEETYNLSPFANAFEFELN